MGFLGADRAERRRRRAQRLQTGGRANGCRSLRIEALETRHLLSATLLGDAVPYLATITPSGVAPLATSGPTGYSPAQIRQMYGFDSIAFGNGAIVANGAGTTVAIVDAYDNPNIANDLHQFSVQFGLPDAVFTKVNQSGGSTLPAANAGWASEIALDVEWVHAIAPQASILLVEAASSSLNNLMAAVNYARHAVGVVAVSMSWGGSEFSGETSYDSYFTTPSGHGGVTFVAASGDTGAPVSFPSISKNVLSVGGTTLSLVNGVVSEIAWSGSGGGISSVESQPSYQNAVVTQSTRFRTNPDVAYDANPSTGFSVYDSYNNPSSWPWSQYGGTSAAAPQWAALVAIADQGRALAGMGALDGATQTLPMLYAMPQRDFRDVQSGTSAGVPRYSAAAGYDLVTGRGSPLANLVVGDLIASTSTTVVSQVDTPGLYRSDASVFYLRGSNTAGYADTSFSVTTGAAATLVPLAGDWTGSGIATVGLYDEATSTFYLKDGNSGGNANTVFTFNPTGTSGSLIPVAGDWNGDGITTIGVYDPTTSTFYLKNSDAGGSADISFLYGPAGAGWLPVAGDWNGSGQTTIGLYNPATSVFYLRDSNTSGYANLAFSYGPAGGGWLPLAGDWTGNGTSTIGLYAPAASTFYLRNTNTSGYANIDFAYGAAGAGWKPIVGNWGLAASQVQKPAISVGSPLQATMAQLVVWAREPANASNALTTTFARNVEPDMPNQSIGERREVRSAFRYSAIHADAALREMTWMDADSCAGRDDGSAELAADTMIGQRFCEVAQSELSDAALTLL